MADNRHLIALGGYRFSIGTAEIDALQRNLSINWAKTDIINSNPNYQFCGITNDGITISGAVFNYRQNITASDSPVNKEGTDQLSLIRQESMQAKPLRLTLDTGKTLGYWVVVNINESQSHFLQSAPLKQAFDLTLKYFGSRV